MKGNTDSVRNSTKPVMRNSHIAVDGMRTCTQRNDHAIFLLNASFHY